MSKDIKNGNGIIIAICIILLILIGASVIYGVKKIERNNEQANMLLYTNVTNNSVVEGNETNTENNVVTNDTQNNTTKTNTSSNNAEDE